MLLEKYIREVIIISERNQPNLLKKSYPYDLLIANINEKTMGEIYEDFQDSTLIDSFIDVSTGSADVGYDINNSVEENVEAISDCRFTLIKLKKNVDVITHLKDYYSFNFSNCNLSDNKPIFCVPASALSTGDNSNILSQAENFKRINKLVKDQAIKDLESWNWAAHDFHHGETAIATSGDTFIDTRKIGSGLPAYDSPQTGYEYMDANTADLGRGSKPKKIRDYWMTLIGFYFNKIGFTRGVHSLDIWASVYAYCLTKMSCPEDAYDMDFTVVNEPGKKTLVVGKGEIKELQRFFANAYVTVHKHSLLNNLKDGIIYIALMF